MFSDGGKVKVDALIVPNRHRKFYIILFIFITPMYRKMKRGVFMTYSFQPIPIGWPWYTMITKYFPMVHAFRARPSCFMKFVKTSFYTSVPGHNLGAAGYRLRCPPISIFQSFAFFGSHCHDHFLRCMGWRYPEQGPAGHRWKINLCTKTAVNRQIVWSGARKQEKSEIVLGHVRLLRSP